MIESKYLRFVLKGPCYNPMDVINALMTRRGYKVLLIMLTIFYDIWIDDYEDCENLCVDNDQILDETKNLRCRGVHSNEHFLIFTTKMTSKLNLVTILNTLW